MRALLSWLLGIGLYVLQVFAIHDGLGVWLNSESGWLYPLAGFISLIPIAGTITALVGAVHGWDIGWFSSIILFTGGLGTLGTYSGGISATEKTLERAASTRPQQPKPKRKRQTGSRWIPGAPRIRQRS